MSDHLLDTCALIWFASDVPLSGNAKHILARQALGASPISVWEIANLIRKRRLTLTDRPAEWFREACFRINAAPTDFDIDILANSCALPGQPPNDPADRIIIATAREYDMTIVTRDRLILDYARAGQVRAMAC